MTADEAAAALLDAALLLAALYDPAVVVRGRGQNQHRAHRHLVACAMAYGQAEKERHGG